MKQHHDSDGVPSGPEIGLVDMAIALGENLRLLVLAPLAAGLIALGYSFTIEPTYTAYAAFMPPQPKQSGASMALQSLGAAAALAGATGAIKSPTDQYIGLMTSRAVLDRMIDRFKLMEVYEAKYRDHARRRLEGSIKATSGKDGLIKLEVEDHHPERAAQMTNGLMEELDALLGRLTLTEAQQRRVFFEKQLKEARDGLTRAQQSLQTSGINVNSLKMQPEFAVSAVAEIRALIVNQEVALESMRQFLTPSAPDYQRASSQLDALRRQLARAAANEPVGGQTDYVAKYREYKYQETLFELFSRQYELAKLDESRDNSAIQIIDKAATPELKSKPKKAIIAMIVTLVTGFAMLLYVLMRATLRSLSANAEYAAKLSQLKATFRAAWRFRRHT